PAGVSRRVERLAYLAELAAAQLDGTRHLILVGARAPASFFAYPGNPSSLVPDGCQVHVLAGPGEDIAGALAALADRTAPGGSPGGPPGAAPTPPQPAPPPPPAGRPPAHDPAAATRP